MIDTNQIISLEKSICIFFLKSYYRYQWLKLPGEGLRRKVVPTV